ncbi:MAG: DNA primase [Dehalococcoidia bacterium]|nr:DNA primase [Dehalococcoidia bacterium]
MSTAAEIKQKIDIVEVVSEHTKLHKSGKNFRGLCPFHAEKEPSFYVFPDNGGWRCFGRCSTGGDIFAFVMKRENIEFVEALHAMAERAGVDLKPHPQAEAHAREREGLHRLNEAAAEYYHNLLVHASAGKAALEYLKKRGVAIETVMDFKLGYAPTSHHNLHPHLEGLGFPRQEIVTAGLARQNNDGTVHDLFRNRLLFPIRDASGRPAGFGGRALDDSTPKYLNTPATPVFDKRSLLYGLDRAREAIRKQDRAVIVEGYMDVIAVHQAGYHDTVATMGVALTQNQLLTLKRLTRNLVLALDADEAGVEATLKGVEVAVATLGDKVTPVPTWQGVVRYERILDAEIRVLALPRGLDPDEVILRDPSQWQGLLDAAPPVMDFLLDALATQVKVDARWQDKLALVRQLRPLFTEIKDPIRWSYYTQRLSRRLGVEERLLSEALSPRAGEDTRRPRGAAPDRMFATDSPSRRAATPPQGLEEHSIALCLTSPELKREAETLPADLFEDSLNRELFRRWQDSPDVDSLRAEAEEPLREHLESVLAHPLPPLSQDSRLAAFQQARLRLQERSLRQALVARRDSLSPTPGDTRRNLPVAEETSEDSNPLEEMGTSIQLRQVIQAKRSLSRKTIP